MPAFAGMLSAGTCLMSAPAAVIMNGKPPIMPSFKSLTAEQRKDLVSYIRSLKK
jgi:hypothetical protein